METSREYLDYLASTLLKIDSVQVDVATDWLRRCRNTGNTVFTCGNGGSAAVASHMICDLIKCASYGRPARFKAMCLSDNTATVLAYANDLTYDDVFLQQLSNFGKKDDVLIAISGSGNSRNILNAVRHAHFLGCKTIGLTGGGALADLVHLPILVPDKHMGRLEDAFSAICHAICYRFIEES